MGKKGMEMREKGRSEGKEESNIQSTSQSINLNQSINKDVCIIYLGYGNERRMYWSVCPFRLWTY